MEIKDIYSKAIIGIETQECNKRFFEHKLKTVPTIQEQNEWFKKLETSEKILNELHNFKQKLLFNIEL